jgi:hypothetical protein
MANGNMCSIPASPHRRRWIQQLNINQKIERQTLSFAAFNEVKT